MMRALAHDTRLRLAYVANSASVHVRRWVNFFARRGHEVTVLDGFGNEPAPELDPSVRLRPYDARGSLRFPLAPMLHSRRTVRRMLRGIDPDVLHAHTAGRYGWQASLAGFHPYVVSTWGSDVLLRPASWRARFWTRRALSGADLVTAVAPFMIDATIRAGAAPDRMVQIHHGVDPSVYHPADERPRRLDDLGLDRPFIFSPRAIRPLYNQPTIIRAVAELDTQHLVAMSGKGADASHRAELLQLATDLGIRDRIRIVDETTEADMIAMYQCADVVVSAATSDSFAVTLLEAMACETPLVVGDLPAIRAGIGDIVPEALVEPTDAQAMARAMRRVLDLPHDARATLGRTLRNRAMEVADYEANMLRMESLYLELASRRRHSAVRGA